MKRRRMAFLWIIAALIGASAVSLHADPAVEALPIYEQWESFTTADGLIDDHAYWVKVDTVNGAVWAGTDNGLACYRDGRWRVYTPADGLAHQAVMGVDVDPRTGEVWVATLGGLNRFSGGRFQTFTQSNSGLANDAVYGVAVQGDTVWVATTAGGGRFIRQTERWDVYTSQNAPMDENWCYNVSVGEGKVFLAVWGGGILEHDLKTGAWQAYHDPDGEFEIELFPDDGLVHNITTGASSAGGLLWASSYFGLSAYDFRRWRSYFEHDSGLASDFVNVVRAQPGTRNGWACTDKGLSVLHYDADLWVTYRPEEVRVHRGGKLVETRTCRGIAHQFVYGVDWQGDDAVWVATARGISRGTKKLKVE
jgi:ligand-binding sensor domain-containing protein